MNPQTIVIVGATSGIAQECARIWVGTEQEMTMILVGRNTQRLERVAADLRVRNQAAEIRVVEGDFLDPQSVQEMVNSSGNDKKIDVALIAHGTLPDQEECQRELSVANNALLVNGLSPVLFAEAFAAYMQKHHGGSIIMLSSVAGDRGRKKNYVYGSAKSMMSCYAQGLQHRFADSDINVLLVKPGPTATNMTRELVEKGQSLAPAAKVAADIVAAEKKKRKLLYTPRLWLYIMFIIKHLPGCIFKRLDI